MPETLNELQVEQLIESVDTKKSLGLRNRAILELLYASGLRISELAGARLEHFDRERAHLPRNRKGQQNAARAGGAKRPARRSPLIFRAERPQLVKSRTGSEIFLSARGDQS